MKLNRTYVKIAIILGLAAGALFLMDTAKAAGSQSDDVTWTLPTERTDGAPLPASELSHTEIEVSKDGVVIGTDLVPAPGVSFTWTRALPPNYTLCYRARVADTEGQLSDWTNPVCKTVKARPNPPGQVDTK